MKKMLVGFILGVITTASVTALAVNSDIFTARRASFDIYVEGAKFESENPPVVIEGRTYLPLKDTGEALGVDVEWIGSSRRVEIGKKKEVVPVPTSQRERIDFKEVKSDTLDRIRTPLDTSTYLIKQDNVYYIYGAVFGNYTKQEDGKYYINLPDREPVLITNANERLTPVENVINFDGYSYIDIKAIGVKIETLDNILKIELE